MQLARFVGAAAVAALFACGSVKNEDKTDGGPGGIDSPEADGDFTLTVDPASLTIPIAGSATVDVSVVRDGTVGDITLTAPNLPGNLSVTFEPATLPEGSNTAVATIQVAGGSAAGNANVTITGSGGGKEHSATVSVTTTTITVTGTVRGGRSGVRVGIIGKSSVLSGAGGVFTFTDVTPPYDLYTLAPGGSMSSPTSTVFYFEDLTKTNPVVSAAQTSTGGLVSNLCIVTNSCPQATINGTRSGSGNNTDPLLIAWSTTSATTVSTNGTWSFAPRWFTGSSQTGNLHGLQFTRKASGAPDTYLGYARSPQTTINDDATHTINLTLAPVASTTTITGTITPPPGYPAPTLAVHQEFGSMFTQLWNSSTTTDASATIAQIPNAGGANFFASASLDGSGSAYVYPITGNHDVTFAMPVGPTLTTPAADATGVTAATMFSFTADPTVLNEVSISTGGSTRAAWRVYTKKTQLTIPNVPEQPIPANQLFNWSVAGYAPTTSVDDAAGATELETVSGTDVTGPPHAYVTSPTRQFTTAP